MKVRRHEPREQGPDDVADTVVTIAALAAGVYVNTLGKQVALLALLLLLAGNFVGISHLSYRAGLLSWERWQKMRVWMIRERSEA